MTNLIKIIILLGLFFLQVGCGSKGGGSNEATPAGLACETSPIVGAWTISPGTSLVSEDLTFNTNCVATSSYCSSTMTYQNTQTSTVAVSVIQTNSNSGCIPVGQASCSVVRGTLNGVPSLLINCGGGANIYVKK